MTKISYIIGVKNEGTVYLKPLLDNILKYKDVEDEVILVDDYSSDEDTIKFLSSLPEGVKLLYHALDGDFAAHKNFMIEQCSSDYIVNFDGDELPAPTLLQTLKEIIINNPEIDLFYLPRVNIVHGITQEDIAKYGWQVSPSGFLNFPDAQGRVFKNLPSIRWKGRVHEVITGTSSHTILPYQDEEGLPVTDYAILHVKDILRQRKQNDLYSTL